MCVRVQAGKGQEALGAQGCGETVEACQTRDSLSRMKGALAGMKKSLNRIGPNTHWNAPAGAELCRHFELPCSNSCFVPLASSPSWPMLMAACPDLINSLTLLPSGASRHGAAHSHGA